jgi:hypothetical protein
MSTSPSISVPFFLIFTFTVANWWKFDLQCLRKGRRSTQSPQFWSISDRLKEVESQSAPVFSRCLFTNSITAIGFTKALVRNSTVYLTTAYKTSNTNSSQVSTAYSRHVYNTSLIVRRKITSSVSVVTVLYNRKCKVQ